MKKLLHIAAHLGGGAGKAISGLIKNIDGYENTVLLLEKPEDEKYCNVCKSVGADVIIAPTLDKITQKANESDVVILNWWAHPLTVDLLSELDSIKTRLVIWSHINGLQYPVFTSEFLCGFDRVMFTSPCSIKNKNFTAEQRERLSEKCSYVYGTGDFKPADYPHRSDYRSGDTFRIGYIGTLDYAKLNPDFPEICHGIRHRISNAEFILCGKYTPEFENAFFSKYTELRNYVSFTGFVSNPEMLLPAFDVFCYPLARDNYATTENALLEAMAAGLPVIVLNNPAESEIVENGITGIVADDAESLAERTAELCKNEEYRKQLGTTARNAVIHKYDASVNAYSFVDTIESVLDIEKKTHDLGFITGIDIWNRFLYFCGDDKQIIIDLMNGKKAKLPEIYYSESKSSPVQYLKYFDDNKIKMLAERISRNARMEE